MMNKYSDSLMISILVLFLLGVATSRYISNYDDDPNSRPMISEVQERRICAELCMAGLGGEPCGQDCFDIIPQGLPVSQSANNHSELNYTGRNLCPVLCENQLGYPLCSCNYTQQAVQVYEVNFLQICSLFCLERNYQIYGCEKCSVYENMTSEAGDSVVGVSGKTLGRIYDWNAWCVKMCQAGDGGAACYCDLLPLGLRID